MKNIKCVDVWNNNKMETMKDFLEYYNNLDVIPFIEAIEKMKSFYKNKKLDLFKDGVSLPGLVLKYLMRQTKYDFSLFKDEDNELFYKLKNSIVGGPSIVFNRYQEAGKTLIKYNKICKKIVGYDANALYLWAIGQEMPVGDYTRVNTYDLEQLKEDILNNKLFGFIEVDIKTPLHLEQHFEDMPPIFKNKLIKLENIGEHMQQFHADNNIKFIESEKLIGSYFGEKIMLYTPLIKWYIEHGLEITKFHCAIKYDGHKCFEEFVNEVSDARRAGDVDKSMEIIAETMKLFGNSAYGKTITNKESFVSTTYANEINIGKKINSPHFKDLETLHNQTYEVTSSKRQIVMDLPLQIGVAVYNLAKLRMLQFYYDCIDKYVDRSDYQILQMDTDSNYFAFSENTLEEIIKPEMREEFKNDYNNWFPSESKEPHPTFKINNDDVSMKAYDKRKPGLFKVECIKDKMVCLCSKMYCCSNLSEICDCCACNNRECKCIKKCSCNFKFSCKGIQHNNNKITYKRFENVLLNNTKDEVINKGFRTVNNFMKTYTQIKNGLSYSYGKRIICEDGISTKPLKF